MAITIRNTGTTTISRRTRWGTARSRIGAFISLLLAVLLVALALPRTVAAFIGLGAERALYDVSWGRTPQRPDVVAGIAALSRAIEWQPSAKRLIDLASLELELAFSKPTDDAGKTTMAADAERHLVEGLRLNPADGVAWLRLAWAKQILGAPRETIARCVAQSLDMAPNVRSLWLPRAPLLFSYWSAMTLEEQLAVRHQLYTIWNADEAYRTPLVKVAAHAENLALLQWSLGNDPVAQGEFERLTRR